jgi:hypothetical protein
MDTKVPRNDATKLNELAKSPVKYREPNRIPEEARAEIVQSKCVDKLIWPKCVLIHRQL